MFAKIENNQITGLYGCPQGTYDYSNGEPVFTPSMVLEEIADDDPRIAEFQASLIQPAPQPTIAELQAQLATLTAQIAQLANQQP